MLTEHICKLKFIILTNSLNKNSEINAIHNQNLINRNNAVNSDNILLSANYKKETQKY